jgi:hypothetical protein
MAYEHLKGSALPRALSDVIADLADLLQKEMRLAREELSSKLSLKLRGGVWIASAGVLALIAGLLVIQAAVFGIASFGIALHWSCLIVAAILAAAAGTAYALGRGDLAAPLTPDRTIRQFKKDATIAREQVS